MSAGLECFRDAYSAAIQSFLSGGGEVSLERAYELGRRAITEDLSVLDLAEVHHDVVTRTLLDASSREELGRIAEAAKSFYMESMSIVEMARRGFHEAQETARLQQHHATLVRGLADAALEINSTLSVDKMMQILADHARRIIGASWCMTKLHVGDESGKELTSLSRENGSATPRARLDDPFDRMQSMVLRSSHVVRITQEELAEHSDLEGATPDGLPIRGWLAAPLVGRNGRRIGLIELSGKVGGEFDESDESMLVQLAQMASVAIENARLYEHEHGIAETLQRSLLPERLPEIPGVDVAARYVPGSIGVAVGGDWYDVIALSRDRVSLTMGDVAGRGIRAAAVMGQLRMAVRAYSLEEMPPVAVVQSVDRLLKRLELKEMATMIYLVVTSGSSEIRFVNAGHPPPLVLAPDGRAHYLQEDCSVPLGVVPHAGFKEMTAQVPPGSIILLYTDGLIERRGVPIQEGLARLKRAVAGRIGEPKWLCERVLEEMLAGEPSDDTALLAVRTAPHLEERLQLRMPAEPESLAGFRLTLQRWLRENKATEVEAFEITVACGEACTNAIEHAYGPREETFEVEARMQEKDVLISVRDFGRWRPPRGARGRGLDVMKQLMDSVEVLPGPSGTEVRLRRRLNGGAGA
jgi:serine phosphatase RsbU (regulator of sigma subunit)/anti-sigma regulatory factor (Ser/Thr protein kinase)